MLKTQHRLTDIHRTLLQEYDDAHISKSTSTEVTEFAINSYVLLEPKQGPYKVLSISGNTYTLENLVIKKPVRVHINR